MRKMGLPQSVLATACGYSERRMASIMSGQTKYLKPQTHDAIMAIGLSAMKEAERGKIDSKPTQKLVAEILEAGYSKGWICRQLGFQASNNLDFYPTITAAKAHKIKHLHDRLWIGNEVGWQVKCGNGRPIYGKPFREACNCYGLHDHVKANEIRRNRQQEYRSRKALSA